MIRTIIIWILLIPVAGIFAQDIPDPPNPPRLVNDFAGILNRQQAEDLERKLVAFNDTNSTQIVVVVVESLQGWDIADYSQRLGQKWGVGQEKSDNGVVIVLKPRIGNEKGRVNINVGYGLEPIITDAISKRIIDNEMVPFFMHDDYYGGLNAAVDVLIGLAAGKFSPDEYQKRTGQGTPVGWLVPVVAIVVILLMMRRRRSGYYSEGKSSLPFWAAMWMLGSMGGSRGGSWDNFRSGSGGFGGGGGGFGGFGGGSFGGGGASGSW